MDIEFVELNLDWPHELSLFELKNYILSKLITYGDPIRWAITSVTTHSEKTPQTISIEVVFMINKDNCESINPELN